MAKKQKAARISNKSLEDKVYQLSIDTGLDLDVEVYEYLREELGHYPSVKDIVDKREELIYFWGVEPLFTNPQDLENFAGSAHSNSFLEYASLNDYLDVPAIPNAKSSINGGLVHYVTTPKLFNDKPKNVEHFYNLTSTGLRKHLTTPVEVQSIYKNPIVIIPYKTSILIQHLVDSVDKEVGWLCSSTLNPETREVTIKNIFVPKQEVHGTTCEITEEGQQELYMELINSGRLDDVNNLRTWCHSHVNMSPTPSGQDIKDFSFMYCNETITDYFIMAIVNKRSELYLEFVDIPTGVKYKNVDHIVMHDQFTDDELKAAIVNLDAQVKKNVSEKKFTPSVTQKQNETANSNKDADKKASKGAKEPVVTFTTGI